MKRRVASLPPVSAHVFAQKVAERKAETAVTVSAKDTTCDVCNKTYTTENAFRSHLNSRRHKANELKSVTQPQTRVSAPTEDEVEDISQTVASLQFEAPLDASAPDAPLAPELVAADLEEQDERSIEERIAATRAVLSTSHCIFCRHVSTDLADNLTHMSLVHSFFVPDADYLIDISGLISYLAEKVAVRNICIFCNRKSREFRTLEAVRKHMVDSSHCKIAYDSQDDRLEVSDYYDFTSSYPEAEAKERKRNSILEEDDDEGSWEDVEDDEDNDEVHEIVDENSESGETNTHSDSEKSLPDNQITFGDSPFELVLPSGARIGHRTMRRYYAQSFRSVGRGDAHEDPNSGAGLVRRLLADKNAALVPRKGGFGAYGTGTDLVKARNRGEAREAGRHVREFRDQRRREDFKTKVGFIHNHQKHYRDPLLQ